MPFEQKSKQNVGTAAIYTLNVLLVNPLMLLELNFKLVGPLMHTL